MPEADRTDESLILILCTAPSDGETPTRLAQGLLNAGLVACVNLLPEVVSHYRWEGEVHADKEVQMLLKARGADFSSIQAWLDREHPYEVPEILAIPVTEASESYLSWALEQTSAERRRSD